MKRAGRHLLVLAAGLCLVGALLPPAAADEDDKKKDPDAEVDHVALAARLVRDGHYDRAELTLRRVDLKAKTVDKKLYYVLGGLIALEKKSYGDAARAFERAIAAGNRDPLVYVNLARSRFGLKDYRGTVAALDRAGPAAEREPQAELLKSRAYWELKQPAPALDVLARARSRFPALIEIPRTEILYLIQLGLFQELASRRAEFLKRDDIEPQDLAAISEALRQGGELDEAKQTLEAARLRFPDDETLTVQLARVLMDQEHLLSSALLLEQAARQNPKYLIEAAELYRRADRLERALSLNAQIADQKAKMKQRLQLLLQLEQFELVSGMEARLSRLGLLGDQQIRYALAYGFFQIRDFEAAKRHIKQLTEPDLFRKGVELRKAIEDCQSAGWMCQ
jgi:tetratricopeptide (TPR) repeat protein